MKPLFIGLGVLGAGLKEALDTSGEWRMIDPSWDNSSLVQPNLRDHLAHGSEKPWTGIIGNLAESNVALAIKELLKIQREAPGNSCIHGYFAFQPGGPLLRDLFCSYKGEALFRRIFLFPTAPATADPRTSMEHVLRVHSLEGGGPWLQPNADVLFVRAEAWPLSPLIKEEKDTNSVRVQELDLVQFRRRVLPSAFDAVNLVVENLRRRIERAHQLSSVVWGYDRPVIEGLLDGILKWRSQLWGEFKPPGVPGWQGHWRAWLALLERGPEALERVRLALQHYVDEGFTLKPIDVPTLLQGVNASPEGEELFVKSIDGELPESIKSVWTERQMQVVERHPFRRERISEICLRLLKILDTVLLRRNLLESLLLLACDGLSSSSIAVRRLSSSTSSVESLKQELRRVLYRSQGDKSYLILPEGVLSLNEVEALRSWIEERTGTVCGLTPCKDSQGWLCLERKLDPCVELPVDTERPAEPRPCKEHSSPPSPSPAFPTSDASSRLPEPCPVCNSAEPDPEIAPPAPSDCQPHCGKKVPPLRCLHCGRLNAKDWWLCRKHGKIALPIPRDKIRCPECILRHHRDPVQYPLSSIGVKPGYREPHPCPNCENLKKHDPERCVYKISQELMPFYLNGVNGHDSVRFKDIAREAKLLDDRYCPVCGTLLIPVNHRRKGLM